MAKVSISFNWFEHHVNQIIDFKSLIDDINHKDDFWGEFICNGITYQYQIWWNAQKIIVFKKGSSESIGHIDNFNLSFSHKVKEN